MGRPSNNAGAQAPVITADAVDPESEVISSQEGTAEMKDPAPSQGGVVKVRHGKGKKITLPNGEIAVFDENGILETDRETAEYLLSIPGYEKG
jgi:hypothetical protein